MSVVGHRDTAPVRPGEELNLATLGAYLEGKVEGLTRSNLEVEQFPGGHSNLTYLLRGDGKEYVLRRAPLGPVPPKAHDMARECKVLAAVNPHFPQAPKPALVCEDPSILGAVFFVMERRRGLILRTGIPDSVRAQPDYAPRISEAFLDCLAQLHSVDIQAHGLNALGKPEGFVERQVKGWSERWVRARTEETPEMDRVMEWLNANIPPSTHATLVHNDYKLDNVMLPLDSIDRVEAVLDWEMATVGDPMIDVGLTLCYWTHAASPEIAGGGVPAFTAERGWYTREQFLDAYSRRTGREPVAVKFHETLGVFKLAVILQQIYFRYWRGQTQDQRFANFHLRVRALTRKAADLLHHA
jgi:aminoglycoside phosphotransferase (APT) family kinase protein